jgi:hypothetical protein
MEAPLYIAILAGQSNMSGRGGVHTSANGTRQWDGVTPSEADAQAGACHAHRRILLQVPSGMYLPRWGALHNAGSVLRWSATSTWEDATEPLHYDIDVG